MGPGTNNVCQTQQSSHAAGPSTIIDFVANGIGNGNDGRWIPVVPSRSRATKLWGRLSSASGVWSRIAFPLSGVVLALHGSVAAENADDLKGDLMAAVRRIVGDRVRIVATLDLHGRVAETMVHEAGALVPWETYRHRDAFSRIRSRYARSNARDPEADSLHAFETPLFPRW
jgi:hypothetical protein